jgi:ABC-type transport system substrate-binding protein
MPRANPAPSSTTTRRSTASAQLDRYTLQLKLTHVDYTLLEQMAVIPLFAVAREAIEAREAEVMRRPVGTGPYRLVEFRSGSRVVLEAESRTTGTYAFPASSDPAHRALVRVDERSASCRRSAASRSA